MIVTTIGCCKCCYAPLSNEFSGGVIDKAFFFRQLRRDGRRWSTSPLAVNVAMMRLRTLRFAKVLAAQSFLRLHPSRLYVPCKNMRNSFIVLLSTLVYTVHSTWYTTPPSLASIERKIVVSSSQMGAGAGARYVRDTDQFIESEMPSKRPLCNKVCVPDAEVMRPHPHLPANHLSLPKEESSKADVESRSADTR